MQEILKTIDGQLTVLSAPEPDCWINLTAPTEMEINTICQEFEIERETVTAALDEEERSRIESDGNATLIVVDVPIIEIDDSSEPRPTHFTSSGAARGCLRTRRTGGGWSF